MGRRDGVLIGVFLVCFFVLFSPLLGWYLFFVLGQPYDSPTGLDKTIVAVIGSTDRDTFSILSIFLAPIGVLIAARISGAANSPLIYISIPFLSAMVLSVIAPLTISPDVVANIGLLGPLDGQTWATKAQITFGRYAESYASTSAVLLGLQLRST